jgi:sugar lactone lactonase YvrE
MMEQVPTSILSAERCHLGEGPTYDVATDTAWWFDILEGRLFEAQLGSGQTRSHQLGRMASALARIDAERQLIAAEDGLYVRSVSDGTMVRVGIRIRTFDACSGFTLLRPIGSLSSPRPPSSQGSDPASYTAVPPASFRTNRQLSG